MSSQVPLHKWCPDSGKWVPVGEKSKPRKVVHITPGQETWEHNYGPDWSKCWCMPKSVQANDKLIAMLERQSKRKMPPNVVLVVFHSLGISKDVAKEVSDAVS